MLVIPDLATDPRTADNALVTAEPRIRFYAGARIKAADGTPIGSLCVIDTVPRPRGLTMVQSAALEGLAFECFATNRTRVSDAPAVDAPLLRLTVNTDVSTGRLASRRMTAS